MPEPKTQEVTFEQLFKNLDSAKGDFEAKMKKVLDLVKTLVKNNAETAKRAEVKAEQALQAVSEQHDLSVSELKTQTNELFVRDKLNQMNSETKAKFDELNRLLDEKIADIKDGEVGAKGDTGESGRDGSPDMGKSIRTKLELLRGEERLDVSAIDGLEERLKEIGKKGGTRVVAGPNANAVQSTDLSSQCDGVNKQFTVPRHRIPLALRCSQFPFEYRLTVDYTTSNLILTLTDEVAGPEAGQSLTFLYVK